MDLYIAIGLSAFGLTFSCLALGAFLVLYFSKTKEDDK